MEIVIDFSQISSNPAVFAWWFFINIGWIIPVIFFIVGLLKFWQISLRNKYRAARKYIVLAIDVPKENLQTPKAVENIFNHLAGAHQPIRFHEKWWFGDVPDSFTFEIISIGGYIQFLIHCVDKYRDLVEAIIYAQYPDAEITEVKDYTEEWKGVKFPNDRYDLWGAELKQAKKEYYPIRTYPEFEDSASKETYKDSMASLMEILTRVGPGEQIWLQFIITIADNDWDQGAKSEINKLIGAKSSGGGGLGKIFNNVFGEAQTQIFGTPGGADSGNGGKSEPNQLLYMTDGQKERLKGIERKTSKLGFHTLIRIIYLAEKSKFNKVIGGSVYGSFKQFNTQNLNSLKPTKYTGGIVYFKKRRLTARKNRLLYQYRSRGHWLEPGTFGKIMNSEELATLWHFPTSVVKAPLIQTTTAKRRVAPISLPREQFLSPADAAPASEEIENQESQQASGTPQTAQEPTPEVPTTQAAPPPNLPIG